MTKVLVFTRSPSHYQNYLYGEMEKFGFKVKYLCEITPFHVINLVLLPFELLMWRLAGARVVHVHWVAEFNLRGTRRFPFLRRLAQAWFTIFLYIIRSLGLRLAWTAHNVLPHTQVFADDIAARRLLVGHSDVVFGHSAWTLARLTELGAVPDRWVAIRHGPVGMQDVTREISRNVYDAEVRELLFFGRVIEYKGVENLLLAFANLPQALLVHLTVAGQCNDPGLRSTIEALARRAGDRVSLQLEHIPDDQIEPLMSAADAVVLPFRHITTSGSAFLALSYGKPLVIPDLPALEELPDDAVFRYDGSIEGLTTALESVITASEDALEVMAKAALAYSSQATWAQAAATTAREFNDILGASYARTRKSANRPHPHHPSYHLRIDPGDRP